MGAICQNLGAGGVSMPAAKRGAPSPAVLAVVQLCLDLQYGRIERLHVRDGELVLDPMPKVIRTVKFSDPTTKRSASTLAEVLSKPQTQAFIREISRMMSGCIQRLEVRDGQPCFMEVEINSASIGEGADA